MPDPLTTAATAWAWDKYGKSLTDKAASALKGHWDKFRWNDAAEKYRAKVKKLYGTMQIMGMAAPVPLDDIFTDVYMLDEPTAHGRFDIEQLKKMWAETSAPPKVDRINGLRLVVNRGNLFILGKPGAGKTTFLKHVAVKAAEKVIPKVPIFISLKQWADTGLALLPFIAERFAICDFPEAQPFVDELLNSGRAVILFDGLDEVNQEREQRDTQTRAMNDFIEKYDRTQCIITCRIAASHYSFQPFSYVELADFNEEQIRAFVGNWFRDKDGEKDEETCNRFLAEFNKEDNKGLRDLARTPLLLTLLCMAFNETLTFPPRRAEIYEEALEALLKRWDASRRIKRDEVYRKLSLGHKENMLARIAAETFEKNEYFIPQWKLEELITDYVRNVPPHDTNEAADGEAILKAIEVQHGVFVERARKVYSFSHLTFQEYFTSKYIVANAAKGTLTNLAKAHCADGRWREVFLLTTSLLPDASQFMTAFRRNVDALLGGDKRLATLLAWADRRSSSVKASPWLVRPSYLFVELYYQSRSFILDRALEFDRALESDRALIRARASERAPDLALLLDHELAGALDCARAGGAADFDLTFARVLDRAYALSRTNEPGFNEFANELSALSRLTAKATAAGWYEFADKLRALMIKHRDVGRQWDLTERQEAQLAEYLTASYLLKSCLELAYMPPSEKEMMLNSLYLPPAQAGEA